MKPFDYLLLLPAVVLGLALSDLAISTQRLLNARRRVIWGWLSPLAAIVAFLKIVTQWWVWFGADQVAIGLTFEMFVGVLISAGLLFLMAATALPDEVADHEVDLGTHFDSVRRRFWSLFAIHFVVVNVISVWTQMRLEGPSVSIAMSGLLVLPVAIALAFVRSRRIQGIALAGFIVIYLGQELGHSLAG